MIKFFRILIAGVLLSITLNCSSSNGNKAVASFTGIPSQQVTFTENKGQVSDQFYRPRPDVLFGGIVNGMAFHLRSSGVSYQLSRVDTWKKIDTLLICRNSKKTGAIQKVPDQTTVYRLDVNWLHCNERFGVQKDDSLPGYANYYHEVCPNGVHNIGTFTGVTYRNIYNGIDLHYYGKNGDLKYDYIVAPHADYRLIQFELKGADAIELLQDGALLIKTPLGDLYEGAPMAFQNGIQLVSKWVLEGNRLRFEIQNHDPSTELVIDPITRIWGTYYGGAGNDVGFGNAIDAAGNVFLAGISASGTGTAIATVGSHQALYGGGGVDGFVAKFNGNGVRQWSTYYGNAGLNHVYGCSADGSGNIYACGSTQGHAGGIATPGSHQSTYGGSSSASGFEAFLVKFNSNGVRQWGTYYGGTGDEIAWSCATDVSGNVYMTGVTSSSNGNSMATAGAHQPVFAGGQDAFLVKFNGNGVRQWGTYYGGNGIVDDGMDCATDGSGNVYVAGTTSSGTSTNIATSGAHQTVHGGAFQDAFLVKFNGSGVRQWGTYYGGNDTDGGTSCVTDASGNIYLGGITRSATGTAIATSGSHQSILTGGPQDGFIVKFNSNGVRQWGTYYGGNGSEFLMDIATDANGNIIGVGQTEANSGTAIATPGSHQSNFGGGTDDGFIVKFNANGLRQWGSYYGGNGSDFANACNFDSSGNIYLSGYTSSNNSSAIASAGSHQDAPGTGANDGFLVKFNECTVPLPVNTTPTSNLTLCAGENTTLSVLSNGSVSWFAGETTTVVLGSGSTFSTPVLGPGTSTFFAQVSNTCGIGNNRLAVTVTVNPSPTISASSGSICAGSSFTLSPTGAVSYTFSSGTGIVNPSATTQYSIIGTNPLGCVSMSPAIVTVDVVPLPTVTVVGGSICPAQSFTLVPSGAAAYTFINGSNIVTPSVTTTYTITGTSSLGCVSAPALATVAVLSADFFIGGPDEMCRGSSILLSVSGATSYTWNTNATSPVISVSPSVTSVYSVLGSNADGCESSGTKTVAVKPVAALSLNNVTTCASVPATLSVNASPPADSFTWYPGNLSGSSVSLNPATTGIYTIEASFNGCKSQTTVTVFVVEKIIPVTAFSYDTHCAEMVRALPWHEGGFITGGSYSITPELPISPTSGNVTIHSATPGAYTVSYHLPASGCTLSGTGIAVLNISKPQALNLAHEVKMEAGASVTLTASGASSYSWSPAQWLSCDDCPAPVASPPATTKFCVKSPGDACLAETCVLVIVDDAAVCSAGRLTVPNAFTPNNDGRNDFLQFDGWQKCVTSFQVLIYDRWGEKVFESSDPDFKWDGSYNGKMLASDVLVFVARATLGDGTRTEKKGNITLIR